MTKIARYKAAPFPLEMHKVRIVTKINLLPIKERAAAISEAGNKTFFLGKLAPIGDWQEKLVAKFVADFGPDAL